MLDVRSSISARHAGGVTYLVMSELTRLFLWESTDLRYARTAPRRCGSTEEDTRSSDLLEVAPALVRVPTMPALTSALNRLVMSLTGAAVDVDTVGAG